jgi:hypothetical protein
LLPACCRFGCQAAHMWFTFSGAIGEGRCGLDIFVDPAAA